MTKEYILNAFKDINYAYNSPSKYDDLSHMLDDLIEDSIYEFIDRLVEDYEDDIIKDMQKKGEKK